MSDRLSQLIGQGIHLTSSSGTTYEGNLFNIDIKNKTLTLQSVKSGPPAPAPEENLGFNRPPKPTASPVAPQQIPQQSAWTKPTSNVANNFQSQQQTNYPARQPRQQQDVNSGYHNSPSRPQRTNYNDGAVQSGMNERGGRTFQNRNNYNQQSRQQGGYNNGNNRGGHYNNSHMNATNPYNNSYYPRGGRGGFRGHRGGYNQGPRRPDANQDLRVRTEDVKNQEFDFDECAKIPEDVDNVDDIDQKATYNKAFSFFDTLTREPDHDSHRGYRGRGRGGYRGRGQRYHTANGVHQAQATS